GPPLTPAEVLQVGREAAAGLAAAHARGLVHRDIKPANLFLESLSEPASFRVRILDFGLARSEDGSDAVTRMDCGPGTPRYMSPEQAEGGPLDGRSDLFSLGSVLYRLATGEQPFVGENSRAVLRAVAESQPVPPHERKPAVPVELSRLILRLLAKDP